MRIVLLLQKEDIQTNKMGCHYEIKASNGVSINFTPDALEEFLKDVEFIKSCEADKKPVFPEDRITKHFDNV